MGVTRHRITTILTAFTLIFVLSATALSPSHFGGGFEAKGEDTSGWRFPGRILYQRRFGGPGSSPPTCRSKCGRCAPCRPVHVSIQPGFIAPLEYYPEAWRCKCGNKLFMP